MVTLYHNTSYKNAIKLLNERFIRGNYFHSNTKKEIFVISASSKSDLTLQNRFKISEVEFTLKNIPNNCLYEVDYTSADIHLKNYITKGMDSLYSYKNEYEYLIFKEKLDISYIFNLKIYLNENFNHHSLYFIKELKNLSTKHKITFEIVFVNDNAKKYIRSSGFLKLLEEENILIEN